jgi:hypothetical protein
VLGSNVAKGCIASNSVFFFLRFFGRDYLSRRAKLWRSSPTSATEATSVADCMSYRAVGGQFAMAHLWQGPPSPHFSRENSTKSMPLRTPPAVSPQARAEWTKRPSPFESSCGLYFNCGSCSSSQSLMLVAQNSRSISGSITK